MPINSARFSSVFGSKQKPLLMAHRGNRALFPENTLAAFKQAFEDGADILETDLHLSANDEFICIHDATVDRTTNGSGVVAEMNLQKIQSFHTLDAASQPSGHRIPTLNETAEILPQSIALAIELKTDRFLEEKTCLRLGSLLKNSRVLERTFAISFSFPRLQAIKKALPEMPVGWISMSRLLPDKLVDLIGAFWPVFFINPCYVHTAHRKGMIVCPLDPTPEPRLKFYLKMGVDAVLSDNPAKTRWALNKINQS